LGIRLRWLDLRGVSMNKRVQEAIDIGVENGGCDGAHHKDWVIDQMIRALAGDWYCPVRREKYDRSYRLT